VEGGDGATAKPPACGSSSAAAGRELLEQAGALGEGAPDELISGRAIGQLVQGKPVGAGDDGSYRADIASP
jgi:hypothetical protein